MLKEEPLLHLDRDIAMGWLVRYAGSGAFDAHHANNVRLYVHRLRRRLEEAHAQIHSLEASIAACEACRTDLHIKT